MIRRLTPLFPIIVWLGWVSCFPTLFFSSTFALPRDNFEVSFPLFQYLVEYFRTFQTIPSWVYSTDGGVWLAPLANTYLLVTPYRLVGYFLGALEIFSPLVAYKISLFVIGIPVFLIGVWKLGEQIGLSIFWRCVWMLFLCFSPLSIGVLHSEQTLATAFFIPFVALFLLRKRYYLAAALIGWAMNCHYPHLWLGYLSVLGIVFLRPRSLQLKQIGLIFLCFFLTVSPLLYSFVKYRNVLSSPERGIEIGVTEKDFSRYEKNNKESKASLRWDAGMALLGFSKGLEEKVGHLDGHLIYSGVGLLIALFLGIAHRVPHLGSHLAILVALLLLSVGVYGPFPRVLWFLPGMGYFRQWFHFTAFLNFHLLLFLVWVLASTGRRYVWVVPLLLLESLLWSHRSIREVMLYKNHGEILKTKWNPDKEQFSLPHVGEFGKWKRIVVPRGMDPWWARQWTVPGTFYFLRENKLRVLLPREYSWKNENGALRVDFHLNEEGDIIFPQYNDGNWIVKDNLGNSLGLVRNPDFFLQWRASPSIVLTRTWSPWPYLVMLLLGIVGLGHYARSSDCPRRRLQFAFES